MNRRRYTYRLCLSISLALVLFLVSVSSFGQSKKKVRDVKGEWVVSNDITPVEARENAIVQAKLEAMRQAGVPEQISESNIQFKADGAEDIFESLSSVEVFGEIVDYKITRENKTINDVGNIIFQVWIDATVIIHKEGRDPGFTFAVDGLKKSFKSSEMLTFTVKASREGYMTMFILGPDESTRLFPNYLEKQEKLIEGKEYKFPRSGASLYEITTERESEVNYLLMLFTKTEINFSGEINTKNILQFIAGISPSQKSLKSFTFFIKK